jgi:hypothetical protein
VSVYANLSGARITKCDLSIPYWGLWVADVEMPTTSPIPSSVTLVLADLKLTGTVMRSDVFAGLIAARIVGGGGGWHKTVDQQEYASLTGVNVSTVLKDAAQAVGERVNVVTDVGLGTFFFREQAKASRFLRQLSGDLWYVDPSGVTQCCGATRSTSAVTSPFLIQEFDPASGRILASTENPGDWAPGRQVSNKVLTTPRTLGYVRHTLGNDGTLRTEAKTAS